MTNDTRTPLTPIELQAVKALERYRRRFMRTSDFGHGVPNDKGKQDPYHANAAGGPFKKFDRFTETYGPRHLDRKRLTGHVTGRRAMFAVSAAQHHRLRWLEGHVLVSLAAVFGLDRHPGLKAFIQTFNEDHPPITVNKALEYLSASPVHSPNRHGCLSEPLRCQEGFLADLKRAMLETSDADRFLARRTVDQQSFTDFQPIEITEVTIDIDGNKKHPDAARAACDLAHRINKDLLASSGFAGFIEVSRNRRGAYLRFRVRWDTPDPLVRNKIILAFQADLLTRYPSTEAMKMAATQPCGIDKVRGLNCFWAANPTFDHVGYYARPEWAPANEPAHLPTIGELYQAQKRRLGPGAELHPRFERLVRIHAGDLITAPLHDLRADHDGGQERLAAYHAYELAPNHTIPQAHLMQFIGYRSCETPVKSAGTSPPVQGKPNVATNGHAVAHDTEPAIATTDTPVVENQLGLPSNVCVVALPRPGSKAYAALHDSSISYITRRSRLAAFAVEHNRGDREAAIRHTLALWELPGGPCTQPDRHRGREQKAAAAVDDWLHGTPRTKPYDPAHKGAVQGAAPRFEDHDLQELEQVLRRACEDRLLVEVQQRHNGSRLDFSLLAVALALYAKNIATITRRHDGLMGQRGEVPAVAIQEGLKLFGCTARAANATAGAAYDLLIQLGQIVLVKDYSTRSRVCRRFGFGSAFQPQAWLAPHVQFGDWAPGTTPWAGGTQAVRHGKSQRGRPQGVTFRLELVPP